MAPVVSLSPAAAAAPVDTLKSPGRRRKPSAHGSRLRSRASINARRYRKESNFAFIRTVELA
jgi:hypothetical protein